MGERLVVTSADGTRVAGWRGAGSGPAVVIANGLGTPPEAWPLLMDDACGLSVSTWYYRGTGGGDRPADPARVRIDDHVDDLVALLDHQGIDRAVLACWSLGVAVGFEAQARHPERVAGLLAVAGVPGGTFHAMGAPLGIPRPLRHGVGVAGARAMYRLGRGLSRVAPRVPANRLTARVLAHSGLLLPAARPEVLLPALREFVQHDFRWYAHLALGAAEYPRMDLSTVRVPTTFVAGRYDVLTARRDMQMAAAQVELGGGDVRFVVLPGSHFLPLEYPERLTDLLRDVVARSAP